MSLRIVPYRWAIRNECYKAQLASLKLERFNDCVIKAAPHVSVILEFSINHQKLCQVTGHLETTVWLECQRCQEPMMQAIQIDLDMCIVQSEQALKKLSTKQDVYVMTAPDISIEELIEDDLIVALPLLPKHQDCQIKMPEASISKTHRPFANLKAILAAKGRKDQGR